MAQKLNTLRRRFRRLYYGRNGDRPADVFVGESKVHGYSLIDELHKALLVETGDGATASVVEYNRRSRLAMGKAVAMVVGEDIRSMREASIGLLNHYVRHLDEYATATTGSLAPALEIRTQGIEPTAEQIMAIAVSESNVLDFQLHANAQRTGIALGRPNPTATMTARLSDIRRSTRTDQYLRAAALKNFHRDLLKQLQPSVNTNCVSAPGIRNAVISCVMDQINVIAKGASKVASDQTVALVEHVNENADAYVAAITGDQSLRDLFAAEPIHLQADRIFKTARPRETFTELGNY